MSKLLEFTGISKSFPGVKALDNVSFSAKGGRVTALMGENGAGKSTLLKILSGDQTADTGTIRINGEDAGDSSLGTAEGTVEVAPISAMVLVLEGEAPQPTEPVVADPVPKGNDSLWMLWAAVGLLAGIGCGIWWKKRRT